MADIYFDEVNGTITGDGSAASPYKYLRMAELQASAGDHIYNAGECHYALNGALNVVYRGGTYKGSVNLKNGSFWQDQSKQHWFQSSTGSWSTLAASGTSYVGTGQLVGAGVLYIDGSLQERVRGNLPVPRTTRFRIRAIMKVATGGSAQIEIKENDGTALWYNFSTASWGSIGPHYVIGDTGGEWREVTTDWLEPRDLTDTGSQIMRVDVVFNAGAESWFQFLDFEFEAAWTQHSGDVYKCPMYAFNSGYAANALWIGGEIRYKAASLAAISAGRFWHEAGVASTQSHVYYQLAAGETSAIFDQDIYAQRLPNFIIDTGAARLVDLTVKNFKNAVTTTTGATITENVRCSDNYMFNFYVSGAGSQTNLRPYAERSYGNQADGGADHPKGFFVASGASGGSMLCIGANSHDIYDDHFQTTGGDLTVIGFLCSGSAIGSGLSLHNDPGSPGDLVARNGTIYHENNTVGGVRDQNGNAGNKLTLSGVAVVCAEGITKAMEYNTGPAAADLTDSDSNNFYNGTADAAYASYVTQLASVEAFDFADLTSFYPNAASPLVGAGANKWWTDGNRPVDADGEPFLDNPDAGGIQSRHSINHPSNL